MKYDLIIVGAGSAGCVLATRLTEDQKRSVLLLEAGPDYPEFATLPEDLKQGNNLWRSAYGPHNWGYTAIATPSQPEPVQLSRGRVVGGTGAINGQVLCRGFPEDYDSWAARGNDEWTFTNVLPYFRKMENDLDFPTGDYHGGDGPIPVRRCRREEWMPTARAFYDACLDLGFPEDPDQNHPDSGGVAARPLHNIDGIRMSTAITHLAPARRRPNLTVRGDVTVRRILFERKRAVGIEGESRGEVFDIYGDQIVLSGGAIASPQILLLSGVGPEEHLDEMSIPMVQRLSGVGKNLRDHPAVLVLFRGIGEPPDEHAHSFQVGLRYSEANSPTRGDIHISPVLMTKKHHPASVQIDSDTFHFGFSVALQNSSTAGSLRLASPDSSEKPMLNYDYLSNSYDRGRMREAVRTGIRISEHPHFQGLLAQRVAPAGEDLSSDEALDNWLLRNAYTQHHSSGTCKMGPVSDETAVVDQYCHVHGLSGLRVVDASVMPDVVRANTNATVIMIAEKVSDWIKEGR